MRLRAAPLFTLFVVVLSGSLAHAEPRELSIGWLMVMDWDSDYPEAAECLVDNPIRPADWTITHESVWLEDIVTGGDTLDIYDLVVTTGHEGYTFTLSELAVLEDYINAGGILWYDDCGGLEIDNFPFGLEIDFGLEAGWPAWGTCYGEFYTIPDANHPLVDNRFTYVAADIRTDAGMVNGHWFTPMSYWDPAYTVVLDGDDQSAYDQDGPMMIAYRHGQGKIVATAADITCALECISYGNADYTNGHMPMTDYYFVYNMLVWVDSDNDGIYDRDEGAFSEVDTDNDGIPDYLDSDSDDDGIPDFDEAGDDDPDTAAVDTDNDTVPDYRDPDADGDGILDEVEADVDVDGDGMADSDIDGDGTPNFQDPDSDGDGTPDEVEGDGDVDGDGIPNFADEDDGDGPQGDLDGDGVPNGEDNCPDDDNPDQLDTDEDQLGDACDDVDDSDDDDTTGPAEPPDEVVFGDDCSCRHAGARRPSAGLAVAWLGLLLAGRRLRRRTNR